MIALPMKFQIKKSTHQTRYYSHPKDFKSLKQLSGEDFKRIKIKALMKNSNKLYSAVCFKGSVYVFVEKLQNLKNTIWLATFGKLQLPYITKELFCACAYIEKIYLISGRKENLNSIRSCVKLDTKHLKHREVARANRCEPKQHAQRL